MDMSLDKAEAAMVAKELKQLLLDAVPLSCNLPRATLPNYDNIPGNLMLSSLGLRLSDRVQLDDMKVRGTLSHGIRGNIISLALTKFSKHFVLFPQKAKKIMLNNQNSEFKAEVLEKYFNYILKIYIIELGNFSPPYSLCDSHYSKYDGYCHD